MATGSFMLTIILPPTGALDPNHAGRALVAHLLDAAKQALGGGAATSGTILYPPGSATAAGSWTFVPPS